MKNDPKKKIIKVDINIADSFKKQVVERAIQLVNEGKEKGPLGGDGPFKKIGIYIDIIPDGVLLYFSGNGFGTELKNKIIYVSRIPFI